MSRIALPSAVEQFDRLPQLICKKCESILTEYYTIKKNFKDKQEELRAKLQNNEKQGNKLPVLQLDKPDTSTNNIKIIIRKKKHKTKKAKKRRIINRLMSSSDDDLEPNKISAPSSQLKRRCQMDDEKPKEWEADLMKYFVCRICSQKFKSKDDITKHFVEHSDLKTKHKDIFNTNCLVVMEKFDNKPNPINSNSVVMYTSDYYIENKQNRYYYTMYQQKTDNLTTVDYEIKSTKIQYDSDASSGESLRSKRRRIRSRSSSETVVINQNGEDAAGVLSRSNNGSPTVIDCIDIGDSTDNESSEIIENTKSPLITNKNDSKVIHKVIDACYNRYIKRIDSSERKILENNKYEEKSLQRKLLSIGTKIINRKGFKCTGLLRYMEYKDLNVIWKETSTSSAGIDGKYVRIATTIRDNDINESNNVGWKDFNKCDREMYMFKKGPNLLNKLKTFAIFNSSPKLKVPSVLNYDANSTSIDNLPRISSVYSHLDLERSKTVDCEVKEQKLLNENPVTNPKQPPKKQNEFSSIKITNVVSTQNAVICCDAKQSEDNVRIDSNTTSIIPLEEDSPSLHRNDVDHKVSSGNSVNPLNNNSEIPYPRIKVKPASELMAQNRTNEHNVFSSGIQNNLPFSNGLRNVLTQPNQMVFLNEQQKSQVPVNNVSHCLKSDKEYVLLDTKEFPNTKTDSPFHYLKDLLLLHHITLLDSNTPLAEKLICLNSLKLMCQQINCQPITLSLLLYGLRNVFCIKVKDMQDREVTLSKLSANWQWQLLKIYNNDVAQKIVLTAKKVNNDTYNYANIFFGILNSIKNSKDVSPIRFVDEI